MDECRYDTWQVFIDESIALVCGRNSFCGCMFGPLLNNSFVSLPWLGGWMVGSAQGNYQV